MRTYNKAWKISFPRDIFNSIRQSKMGIFLDIFKAKLMIATKSFFMSLSLSSSMQVTS